MRFKAVGEVQEGLEHVIYRRDGDMLHLQDRLESLSVDLHLLKAQFEHFTEDHWHPFQ